MCCGVLIGCSNDADGAARRFAPPRDVNAHRSPGIGGRFLVANGCCGWQSKKNASGVFSAIDVSVRPGGVLVVGRNNQRALRRRALPCKIAWVEQERSVAVALQDLPPECGLGVSANLHTAQCSSVIAPCAGYVNSE